MICAYFVWYVGKDMCLFVWYVARVRISAFRPKKWLGLWLCLSNGIKWVRVRVMFKQWYKIVKH